MSLRALPAATMPALLGRASDAYGTAMRGALAAKTLGRNVVDTAKADAQKITLEQATIKELQEKYGKTALVKAQDLNQDGQNEIVVLDHDGYVRIFENADQRFAMTEAFSSGLLGTNKLDFAKNDDGSVSILVARDDEFNVRFDAVKQTDGTRIWKPDVKFESVRIDLNGDDIKDEILADFSNGKVHISLMDKDGKRTTQEIELGGKDFKNLRVEKDESGRFTLVVENNHERVNERGTKIDKENGLQYDYQIGNGKFWGKETYVESQFDIDTSRDIWAQFADKKSKTRYNPAGIAVNITRSALSLVA